jgi:hypothetical protein
MPGGCVSYSVEHTRAPPIAHLGELPDQCPESEREERPFLLIAGGAGRPEDVTV